MLELKLLIRTVQLKVLILYWIFIIVQTPKKNKALFSLRLLIDCPASIPPVRWFVIWFAWQNISWSQTRLTYFLWRANVPAAVTQCCGGIWFGIKMAAMATWRRLPQTLHRWKPISINPAWCSITVWYLKSSFSPTESLGRWVADVNRSDPDINFQWMNGLNRKLQYCLKWNDHDLNLFLFNHCKDM